MKLLAFLLAFLATLPAFAQSSLDQLGYAMQATTSNNRNNLVTLPYYVLQNQKGPENCPSTPVVWPTALANALADTRAAGASFSFPLQGVAPTQPGTPGNPSSYTFSCMLSGLWTMMDFTGQSHLDVDGNPHPQMFTAGIVLGPVGTNTPTWITNSGNGINETGVPVANVFFGNTCAATQYPTFYDGGQLASSDPQFYNTMFGIYEGAEQAFIAYLQATNAHGTSYTLYHFFQGYRFSLATLKQNNEMGMFSTGCSTPGGTVGTLSASNSTLNIAGASYLNVTDLTGFGATILATDLVGVGANPENISFCTFSGCGTGGLGYYLLSNYYPTTVTGPFIVYTPQVISTPYQTAQAWQTAGTDATLTGYVNSGTDFVAGNELTVTSTSAPLAVGMILESAGLVPALQITAETDSTHWTVANVPEWNGAGAAASVSFGSSAAPVAMVAGQDLYFGPAALAYFHRGLNDLNTMLVTAGVNGNGQVPFIVMSPTQSNTDDWPQDTLDGMPSPSTPSPAGDMWRGLIGRVVRPADDNNGLGLAARSVWRIGGGSAALCCSGSVSDPLLVQYNAAYNLQLFAQLNGNANYPCGNASSYGGNKDAIQANVVQYSAMTAFQNLNFANPQLQLWTEIQKNSIGNSGSGCTVSVWPVQYNAWQQGATINVQPATPVDVKATGETTSSITYSWSVPPTGSAPITYTGKYRARGAGTWTPIGGTIASPYVLTGLDCNTAYDFRVRAHGAGGLSGPEAPAWATTSACSAAETPGPSASLLAAPTYSLGIGTLYSCVRNFYVDGTIGSNSYDGTSPTHSSGSVGPWATIPYADTSSRTGGDCVNVAGGLYTWTFGFNGQQFFQLSHGGTAASATGYVAYKCETLDACHIQATGSLTYADNVTMWTINAPYVIIDGFNIDGNGTLAYGGYAAQCIGSTQQEDVSTHHIWVLNSQVHDCGLGGIGLGDSEWFFALHDEIYYNAFTNPSQGSGIGLLTMKELGSNQPKITSNGNWTLPNMPNYPTYTPTTQDNGFSPFHNVVGYNLIHDNGCTICMGKTTDATTTGSTVSGAAAITGLGSGTGIAANQLVVGPGLPPFAYTTGAASGGSVTLTRAPLTTQSGGTFIFYTPTNNHTDGNGLIIDTNCEQDPSAQCGTVGTPVTGNSVSYPDQILVAFNAVFSNGGQGLHGFASGNTTFANNSAYGDGLDYYHPIYCGAGVLSTNCGAELSNLGDVNDLWYNNLAVSIFSRNCPMVAGNGRGQVNTGTVWQRNTLYGGGNGGLPCLFDNESSYWVGANNQPNTNPLYNAPPPDLTLQGGSPAIGYFYSLPFLPGGANNSGAYQ